MCSAKEAEMQAMLMAFDLDKCNTKLIILNISIDSQPRSPIDASPFAKFCHF